MSRRVVELRIDATHVGQAVDLLAADRALAGITVDLSPLPPADEGELVLLLTLAAEPPPGEGIALDDHPEGEPAQAFAEYLAGRELTVNSFRQVTA